jgi:hypothetical protein
LHVLFSFQRTGTAIPLATSIVFRGTFQSY